MAAVSTWLSEVSIKQLAEQGWFGPELSAILLAAGQQFSAEPQHLDPRWEHLPGVKKACYQNCTRAVWDHPQELTYVEGYARGTLGLPLAHAWLIDSSGAVIDPTWEQGSDYFGIVFSPEQLNECLELSGQYGILASLWSCPELGVMVSSWFGADDHQANQ